MAMNARDLLPMTSDPAFAAGLVQVPEGRQLFDRMSVQDNLLMGAFIRDDKAAIVRDLDKMYTLFPRLAERRRQLAGSLSGGEQQICAMARGLMAAPILLMIDEMSLGLAPVVVKTVDGCAGNDPRRGCDNSIG
jgi:branched-chain amino acid transport system ATP-binding protein